MNHTPFAVFDLDGTLIDSMGYWQRLEREYLAERGVTEGIDAILEELKPLTITEAGRIFVERFGFPGTAESVGGEMQNVMDGRYRHEIPLKDGAKEYVEDLRRRGVKLCVASATAEELMQACLEREGVADCFAFMISCIEVGAGKRQPDIYYAAARRLGAEPGQITVYEDAPYALETAKNAGFHTVAVYDRYAAAHWEDACRIADASLRDWHGKPVPRP